MRIKEEKEKKKKKEEVKETQQEMGVDRVEEGGN